MYHDCFSQSATNTYCVDSHLESIVQSWRSILLSPLSFSFHGPERTWEAMREELFPAMPPLRPRMGWEGMKVCVLYSTVILPPVVVVVVAVTPGDEREGAPRKSPSPPQSVHSSSGRAKWDTPPPTDRPQPSRPAALRRCVK